ncbi:MAG TPA: TraR/DksA family transcriptional regulator [Candidatus Limnocylindria bacterium]|nr:TraR/DksA family transcriptional regulator [Candidatus Limnocylindria bacterium]
MLAFARDPWFMLTFDIRDRLQSERQELLAGIAQRDAELATPVEDRARIDRGSYGICVDCGDRISEGRLEARPQAARCIACQTHLERRS